jgi:hypothetical protein
MRRKKPTLAAAFRLSLGWMLAIGSAAAQQQGPPAHHQPSAADVPASDSVRGDPTLGGQPSKSPPTKRSRSRRAQGNVDVILKTPNICSNCNQ